MSKCFGFNSRGDHCDHSLTVKRRIVDPIFGVRFPVVTPKYYMEIWRSGLSWQSWKLLIHCDPWVRIPESPFWLRGRVGECIALLMRRPLDEGPMVRIHPQSLVVKNNLNILNIRAIIIIQRKHLHNGAGALSYVTNYSCRASASPVAAGEVDFVLSTFSSLIHLLRSLRI